MRVLRFGMQGDDVFLWQNFLIGLDPYSELVATGVFDKPTEDETKAFQRKVDNSGKNVDGVVGPKTYAHAMLLGFSNLEDSDDSEYSENWPQRPEGISPLSPVDRMKLFGSFTFRSAPVKSNPEAIVITDSWDKANIVLAKVPQLKKVSYSENVSCHKLIADQLRSLFNEWEKNDMTKLIITYGGMWVPRFIRGSRTSLSNHSWGTAFDINMQWNGLGVTPALKGKYGSVRELVDIAYKHGFYWGGHFKKRPDGMHFEAFKVL